MKRLQSAGRRVLALLLAGALTVSFTGCTTLVKDLADSVHSAMSEPEQEIMDPTWISTGYAYDQLTAEEQLLYRQAADAIEKHQTERLETPLTDEEQVWHVLNCIEVDHPEYFWWENYDTLYTVTENNVPTGTEIELDFLYDEAETAARQAQIDARVTEWLSGIDASWADYDKVKAVYDAVVLNTEYVDESPDNQNICSVFLNGQSVCAGYAKATQYLLQKLDIPAAYLWGDATKDGETDSHAWNLVQLDGVYYYLDPTWGDPEYSEEDAVALAGTVCYDYFCVTSEELFRTHENQTALTLPECTSETHNYYVRSGLRLDSYDPASIASIVDAAYYAGQPQAEMQFRYEEDYWTAQENLEDVFYQCSFDWEDIGYTGDDDMRTLLVIF